MELGQLLLVFIINNQSLVLRQGLPLDYHFRVRPLPKVMFRLLVLLFPFLAELTYHNQSTADRLAPRIFSLRHKETFHRLKSRGLYESSFLVFQVRTCAEGIFLFLSRLNSNLFKFSSLTDPLLFCPIFPLRHESSLQ